MKSPLRKLLVFAISAIVLICPAQTFANKAPIEYYHDALDRLEKIESRNPALRVDIVRLREAITELYSYSDLTDPKDAEGNYEVPDLSRGSRLYDSCEGLRDDALKASLNKLVKDHSSYNYTEARKLMFGSVDNVNGMVECIYTGKKIKTSGIPSHSIMNAEHSWPQSKGAKGIAKTDLHHLFPCDSNVNSRRGNSPFAYVSHPTWQEGGSKSDKASFEVRKEKRGDIARALFYFSVRYNMRIDSKQEQVLKEWHEQDPVDAYEKRRNDKIQNFQNNRNPFIDRPEFVGMIKDF